MKKTIISTALILMMSLLLNGCFGYYSIKVVSGKDYIDKYFNINIQKELNPDRLLQSQQLL